MASLPPPLNHTRLGFHYFPDTQHYRESDLIRWLPELQSLGASWLTLIAPNSYAVPEYFLTGMSTVGIEPILHFHFPLETPPQADDLRILFNTYTRWGVRYVALFDRPNLRAAWSVTGWSQSNLVERFLDRFIPLAETAHQCGLIPVFPPLEPGGDYWDTAFLRAALRGLRRRRCPNLITNLVLGAYGWADNRPLTWGAGGPERWPGVRPYHTPRDEEDQRGFRIFDWYLTLARAELDEPCRILLLGAGSRLGDHSDPDAPAIDPITHAHRNLQIARLMIGEYSDTFEPVPPEVLACNFWLLSASTDSPYASHAWFQPDGQTLPAVSALRQWVAESHRETFPVSPAVHPVVHYLLLPSYEWGIADWHLEVIRPFVKKYRPTVGFSLAEASLASRITVVGGPQVFPDTVLGEMRAKGCRVDRVDGDGTQIATTLANL